MAEPDTAAQAARLDAADPLRAFTTRFEKAPGVLAYFDGNSLGRPVAGVAEELARFVRHDWGTRLIRSWDEGWMTWPEQLGDRLGEVALGAAAGQVVVADSTTVMLYKLLRALADAQRRSDPRRTEIVVDTDNFPTDRYVAEGVAAERDMVLRWIEADPATGVTTVQVEEAVGERTAVVLLSHVAYRSGYVADGPGITTAVHAAGGFVLWDLSHSVGSVPVDLDRWGADAAAGCSYKYLCGGPGAPAFGYLATRHQGVALPPVQGWMGRRDPFQMGSGYAPAAGVRGLVSGTPPIVAMVPLRAGIEQLEQATLSAVRAKSLALTDFAWSLVQRWPARLGVLVASPREHDRRGGHLTLRHPRFRQVLPLLWQRGVIPDFREPDGLRLGLSPMSTTFTEVELGLEQVRRSLVELAG